MNNPKAIRSLLRLITVGAGIAVLHATTLSAQTTVKPVPSTLEPPGGHKEFLRAGAIGTQNYICMPSGWSFIGPQATLFVNVPWITGTIRQQVTTHFLSPNPKEAGTPRPAWQGSFDTSAVWANPIVFSPESAEPGAIPWLLLQVVGDQKGPAGGSAISEATYIQRINTTGGVTPTGACTVGARMFVPYTADYVFFRKAGA